MYRIGVVGPYLSVNRILEVASKIEKEMMFSPFPYYETKEVKDIILKYKHQVDFWLFSGYIPYLVAKNTLPTDENLVYIFASESSMYKGLIDLSYNKGRLLNRVSIDIYPSTMIPEYEEGMKLLKMTVQNLYVKEFDVDIDPDELFQYHYALWKEKKTDAALTCYPTVNEALNKAGVPSFWMSPTQQEIYQSIKIFIEKIKTSYYKDTQVGVEMIKILDFDAIKDKIKKPYQLQYLELRLKETLIQLSEKLDGSLFDRGDGKFAIFSTRGTIEREIQTLNKKIQILSMETDTSVAVGIGYGQTVLLAEENALLALCKSKEKEDNRITIVQEDGTIIETPGQNHELIYSYQMEDPDLIKRLEEGNVGVKTFKKIVALIKKMNWETFTTKDLALNLGMSERNAQKIIADLCTINLVEYVGKKSSHSRGRPNKIYKLKRTAKSEI